MAVLPPRLSSSLPCHIYPRLSSPAPHRSYWIHTDTSATLVRLGGTCRLGRSDSEVPCFRRQVLPGFSSALRACCAARPLDAPACGERYHKRIPTSTQRASSGSTSQPPRFHSPALSTSASLSTSSTSSPTDSTPEVSSPLPSTSSLVAPPQPSAKLHAKPLHSIWAPAAAEVGIADRLKHKSRREELAVAQTRLVDGSSELGGDRVTTKTVTFLIWNQPECYPEEVLVHLEDHPLYTPHNLLDIISELSSNGQVCPAQIFNRDTRSWPTMGAGVTLRLGQGEDVVCIRTKGLSESQCLGLPAWASSRTFGKRPLGFFDAADIASTSPSKRIRSASIVHVSPSLSSPKLPHTSDGDISFFGPYAPIINLTLVQTRLGLTSPPRIPSLKYCSSL
ncbi:hypothetical protein BD309DRAFT_984539 [Dichomitus squalens]|nr:hypothetical protein BD309DRAFT_984539 [Dichomitus squalens]